MDLGEIMRQAQQMQAQMKKVQQELASETYTAGVGRGAVVATITGEMEFKEIKIDPGLAPMNDAAKLAEMIRSCVNEAVSKSKESAAKKMSGAAGGLNIPGLSNMLGK